MAIKMLSFRIAIVLVTLCFSPSMCRTADHIISEVKLVPAATLRSDNIGKRQSAICPTNANAICDVGCCQTGFVSVTGGCCPVRAPVLCPKSNICCPADSNCGVDLSGAIACLQLCPSGSQQCMDTPYCCPTGDTCAQKTGGMVCIKPSQPPSKGTSLRYLG